MKAVHIFSRYSRLGASSRLRTMQYIPTLRGNGFEVTVSPFFDDAYLTALYSGVRDRSNLLRFTLARVAQCRAAHLADVIWVEKEVLPWFPWVFEQMALPPGVPVVSDYDDAVFHRYDLHRSALVRSALGRKIDRVMAHSALVTAGNAYLADRAWSAGARRVEIVPTVVDSDLYHPASVGNADGRLRIGWIGTPHTWEKYGAPRAAFLQHLARTENAVIRLVGARLETEEEGSFEYVAWTEASEILSIQTMDIGIMPLIDDPWERGKCGYKLIQYMACALPVVASPVGVNTEIVEHGVNGFLASTDEEWRDALRVLLSDPDLRRRMGEAGRRKVVETYSIASQGPRMANLLSEIVEKHQ